MKFILCAILYCSIACASGNNSCDSCEWPSPSGSPTVQNGPTTSTDLPAAEGGRVFRIDSETTSSALSQKNSAPFTLDPEQEINSVEPQLLASQNSLDILDETQSSNASRPLNQEQEDNPEHTESTIGEQDASSDKIYDRFHLSEIQKTIWNCATNSQFIMPCIAVIGFLCLRSTLSGPVISIKK